ncbi:hypothetical protein AVEN_205523-1 [Araneus ventricosus]|uniref:Uncharacterized protein n=1 Tax=Araneus ventricosus TaxID=182803 RepID=A0A4Y2MA96_ARAVE|nr:hypothetical protein AVEN_205523-1 [Araneus ventricosus]
MGCKQIPHVFFFGYPVHQRTCRERERDDLFSLSVFTKLLTSIESVVRGAFALGTDFTLSTPVPLYKSPFPVYFRVNRELCCRHPKAFLNRTLANLLGDK